MTEVRLIAHRGSSHRYPEHTRAAYQQAVEDGADGIETDVQLTADGSVLCWHDDTIDRTTNRSGRIADWTLSDLSALDLVPGLVLPASHGDPGRQLMTLTDLVELARSAGRPFLLAVELKPALSPDLALVDAVLASLDTTCWDPATGALGGLRISLMSFDLPTIHALLDRLPDELVMLLTDGTEGDAAGRFELLDEGRAQAGPSIEWARRHPHRVRQWLAQGSTVRVWTVDTDEDLDFSLALRIGEVTTNRPAELRETLRARAAGPGVPDD